MKSFSFSLFNIISVLSIVLLIILIVVPFNLINLEQAERIAKWKSEYEKLKYSLELVNLHEGSIVPNQEEIGKVVTEELIWDRILQYMNVEGYKKPETIKKYNIDVLKPGWNTLEDEEEIFYIPNPALGLWINKQKFGDD